jgi:hypothetical protein
VPNLTSPQPPDADAGREGLHPLRQGLLERRLERRYSQRVRRRTGDRVGEYQPGRFGEGDEPGGIDAELRVLAVPVIRPQSAGSERGRRHG